MKKLTLSKETLSSLDAQDLGQVAGGQKLSIDMKCVTNALGTWCVLSIHKACPAIDFEK